MAEFEITRDDVPLWTEGEGKLVLKTSVANGNLPLTPGSDPGLVPAFNIDGDTDVALGGAGTVRIGVNSTTAATLIPIWREHARFAADLIDQFQLAESLTDENLILVFRAGAALGGGGEVSYRYSVLTASTELNAGTDAAYTYARAFPRSTNLFPMLRQHFRAMKLPAQVETTPEPGEVIALEYGGYLQFGASTAAGYDIKGVKSIEIGDLKLSEYYPLSVIGKLSVDASLAGRYSIELRRGADENWTRVIVRRTRTKEFEVAGDVNVDTIVRSEEGPSGGQEFLGALLGVNAKNWLNFINRAAGKAGRVDSAETLMSRADSLATLFLDRFAGKTIESLLPDERLNFLDRINQAVESYRKLGASAVSLYDRFFDPVLNRVDELTAHLESLAQMISWDQLKGEINPVLWNTVQQLTDGDPLGWSLGRRPGSGGDSLAELKKRANDTLELIRARHHEEIRRIIELANTEFGVEQYFKALEAVDNPDGLRTTLTAATKGFLNRLVGRVVDQLSGRDLKKVFQTIKAAAGARQNFWSDFELKLREAANLKLKLAITSAYNEADERAALIDVEIRMAKNGHPFAAGRRLLQDASNGNFASLLSHVQPEVVRLHQGLLTHAISSSGSLNINIAGWHLDFEYAAPWRVLTQSEQQIRASGAGMLNVFTEVDMSVDSERRRKRSKSEETMHTNFLLRYLGETRGVIADASLNEHDKQYALEVITGQAARYECTFTDENTTPEELEEYLAFAKSVGLDKAGATAAALAPLLQKKDGDYGAITAEYNVQFNEAGLSKLFATPVTDAQIRTILRRIVVANYIGRGNIAAVAALYASDRVRELYREHGINFARSASILQTALRNREVLPEPVIPGVKYPPVSNDTTTRTLVTALLDIEDDLIEALRDLREVLTSGNAIPLSDFENRMHKFGSVLNRFDRRDLGDNTVFAVIDGLIALNTPAPEARSSSMEFGFIVDGKPKNIVFLRHALESAHASRRA